MSSTPDDLGLVASCLVHTVDSRSFVLTDVTTSSHPVGLWGQSEGCRRFVPLAAVASIAVHSWREPDPTDGLF